MSSHVTFHHKKVAERSPSIYLYLIGEKVPEMSVRRQKLGRSSEAPTTARGANASEWYAYALAALASELPRSVATDTSRLISLAFSRI